jgi:hypothetical protein
MPKAVKEAHLIDASQKTYVFTPLPLTRFAWTSGPIIIASCKPQFLLPFKLLDCPFHVFGNSGNIVAFNFAEAFTAFAGANAPLPFTNAFTIPCRENFPIDLAIAAVACPPTR